MIAALGSLPFLATIWLVVVLGAAVLEESAAKIAAALKGSPAQPSRKLVQPRRGGTVPQARDCPSLVSAVPRLRAAA